MWEKNLRMERLLSVKSCRKIIHWEMSFPSSGSRKNFPRISVSILSYASSLLLTMAQPFPELITPSSQQEREKMSSLLYAAAFSLSDHALAERLTMRHATLNKLVIQKLPLINLWNR